MEDIDTVDAPIRGENRASVFVSDWDEGKVWMSIQICGGSASVVLEREAALEMIAQLQKALG